mgnify:FL=1
MKCIVHIGTEKTGTTYIQDCLYENWKEFRRKRIYLSQSLGFPNNRHLVAYFESEFKVNNWSRNNGISTEEERDDFFYDFENTIKQEIREANANTVIMTSEHFHSQLRKPEEIHRFRKFLEEIFDEVKIVCFFREQYEMALSCYSTILKVGWSAEIEKWIQENCTLDNYYYDHMSIADRWVNEFGRENCIYELYDPNIDVFDKFMSLVNLDASGLKREKKNANVSLSTLQAEAFRIINKKISHVEASTAMNRKRLRARAIVLSSPEFSAGILESANKETIRELFRERNEKFLEKYFSVTEFPARNRESCLPTREEYKAAYESFLQQFIFTKVLEDVEAINVGMMRDAALAIRSTYPEIALGLMTQAHRFRPNGTKIVNYLKQWCDENN